MKLSLNSNIYFLLDLFPNRLDWVIEVIEEEENYKNL